MACRSKRAGSSGVHFDFINVFRTPGDCVAYHISSKAIIRWSLTIVFLPYQIPNFCCNLNQFYLSAHRSLLSNLPTREGSCTVFVQGSIVSHFEGAWVMGPLLSYLGNILMFAPYFPVPTHRQHSLVDTYFQVDFANRNSREVLRLLFLSRRSPLVGLKMLVSFFVFPLTKKLLKPSPFTKILVIYQTRPHLVFFYSTIYFCCIISSIFRKLLMTSLNAICCLPPSSNQKSWLRLCTSPSCMPEKGLIL